MPLSARPRRRSTYAPVRSDIFTRYARGKPSTRARRFIETECLVPMGRGEGKPYQLRPVHRRWLRESLDTDALTIVISGPRGMGKTGWMAAVGVEAVFSRPGAQVLFLGTSMRAAMRAYGRAVRIIETSERLSEAAMIYRNKAEPWTELPTRGAIMRPLPALEPYIVGEAPTMILMDELGYIDHSTYEAMQTSLGKHDGARLIAFGTPGLGVVDSDASPNTMYQLRSLSLSATPPPDLVYLEHAAGPTDDPADVRTWRKAYGCTCSAAREHEQARCSGILGDLVTERAVAHDFATMPPSRFGQMRLGLWTDHEAAWMPRDAWEALDVEPAPLEPGALVSLGFDGSVSRDSTALVAHEPATGRIVVLGHWPGDGTPIPRAEVVAAIDEAFSRFHVLAMYADPWHWRSELQELAAHHGEDVVVEWNSASSARMGPASDAFLAAVLKGEITHDGSQALKAHMLNAVAKRTAQGDLIARDARRPRDTDLATAAILAYEASRTAEPAPAVFVY